MKKECKFQNNKSCKKQCTWKRLGGCALEEAMEILAPVLTKQQTIELAVKYLTIK
jgi:hypothetical protein